MTRGARVVTAPSTAWRNRITGSGEEAPDQLLANPGNWRLHPKHQQAAIAGALDTVGWVQQVIVNTVTGHMVDGHARVEQAISRGEASVPVLYVELTPEEEALVLATFDPIGAMANTDEAKLNELLSGVTIDEPGLLRLLQGMGSRRPLKLDPDELPPAPTEVYVKAGELWQLGDHRLLCGDATDPAAVTRLLDGAKPRLLNTDPPYGVQLDPTWRDGLYNGLGPGEKPYMITAEGEAPYMTTEEGPGARIRFPRRTEGHTNTTLSGDVRADWSEAFELVPSVEVGYVWHAGVYAAEVAAGLERIGFEIASQVIWDKGLFAMSRGWYHWGHEPCWVIRKPGVPNLYIGTRDQSTVWRAASPKMIMGGSDEEKFDHPAQKPVVLFEIPLHNHTEAGEAVYDPFLGSGTALIAAETLGRRCYGMEIDPKYCQLVVERWQNVTGKTAERVDG
ncbi:MAG: DNA methyltransferase [Chloroflexota bacterium]